MKSEQEIKIIETELETLLYTVMDPEVELNIVDLGLIYSIRFNGENNVDITMTLSTPACPLGDAIVMNIKQTINNKFPDFEIDVQIVFDPAWSVDMISEDGKRKLGM